MFAYLPCFCWTLLLAVWFCSAPAGCKKDKAGTDGAAAPLAEKQVAPAPAAGSKAIQVKHTFPGQPVAHDGQQARMVDMRIRAQATQTKVQPDGYGWKAGGDWRVFELPYRRGKLAMELALLLPADGKAGPGKARLRWLSGDAEPFLSSLAFIFQAELPAGSNIRGRAIAFDVELLSAHGKDLGRAEMELTGGQWLVMRAKVGSQTTALFDLKISPARSLARLAPVAGQDQAVVMGLFATALR